MTRVASPLRFVIPSNFAEGRAVLKRILDEVERLHYNQDAVFAIRLALDEALINAIKHGNRFDKDKKVSVEATITPGKTEIIIEDEGVGFTRTRVADPTSEENLERLNGRGILLMETYMNEVEYQHGGRRIRMVRRNEPAVPGGAGSN